MPMRRLARAASPSQSATFGELLRSLRHRANLTQYDLAIRVGYSECHISRLENNLRRPDLEEIQTRFMAALQLQAESESAVQLLQLAHQARHPSNPLDGVRRQHSQLTVSPKTKQLCSPPNGAEGMQIRNNLPQRLTSFIGREQELSTLWRWMANNRLVTVTGVGGSGKTSLALEAARRSMADNATSMACSALSHFHFKDGIWYIELAPLSAPTLVARTIALTLGINENKDEPLLATLMRVLHTKQLLLVVDNCEHILQAVAQVGQALLQSCPQIWILATSREPLRLPGEIVLRISQLGLPTSSNRVALDEIAQAEAVQLFVERARSVLPDFRLTAENAPAVIALCYQLDGLPLAIELAAARIGLLRVTEIVARLADRFSLLINDICTAPNRHQTLHKLVDWSYNLLDDSDRRLFRHLSIFAGDFTLEAVEAVENKNSSLANAGVFYHLSSLVDKSLVIVQRESGCTARYHLLEIIRLYAREKLVEASEATVVGSSHLTYFLRLAETTEPKLKGAEQVVWLQHMAQEQANFRAALTYAQQHDPAAGLQLLLALQHFCNVRGYWCEWAEWLVKLMATPGMPPSTKVGRRALSLLALNTADQHEADQLFATSAALCQISGDKQDLAHYHLCQASRVWWDNSIVAKAHFEQSLLIFREIGDQWHTAFVLRALGELVQVRLEAFGEARSLLTLSLELYREQADEWGVAEALAYLANTALAQGDLVGVQAYAQEALRLSKQLDFKEGIFWASLALGVSTWGHGHYAQAAPLLQDASAVAQATGDQVYCAVADYWLATNIRHQGEYTQAATLYQNMLRASRAKQYWWGIGFSLYGLGEVARLEGDIGQSINYLTEALVALDRITYRRGITRILDSLALLAFPNIKAVHFFSIATVMRSTTDSILYPIEQAEVNGAMTTLRTLLDAETFAAVWSAGQAMTRTQAIEDALQWATYHFNLPSATGIR